MSCPIKTKTINFLKDKNVMLGTREVTDYSEFSAQNRKLTRHAFEKWGVGAQGVMLFTLERKTVPRGDGSYRELLRAIPNDKLFNALQEQIDNNLVQDDQVTSIFNTPAPVVNFKPVPTEKLVSMDNPIEMKSQQDKLVKDIEEFNKFINCLW